MKEYDDRNDDDYKTDSETPDGTDDEISDDVISDYVADEAEEDYDPGVRETPSTKPTAKTTSTTTVKTTTRTYAGDVEDVDDHMRKRKKQDDLDICTKRFDSMAVIRSELFVFLSMKMWRFSHRGVLRFVYTILYKCIYLLYELHSSEVDTQHPDLKCLDSLKRWKGKNI